MIKELIDNYQQIAEDYLLKKRLPWVDFEKYLTQIKWHPNGILIDVGTGNGRNLNLISKASLLVGIDISYKLLQGFIGPVQTQRIRGSLPNLPIRTNCTDNILVIAVIHHLNSENLRLKAMLNIYNISLINSRIIFSVWRKWRNELRNELIAAIRKKERIQPLIDVNRPWHDSNGNILGTRFYHYFTRKELIYLLNKSNFKIINLEILGGRNNDANFFVFTKPG